MAHTYNPDTGLPLKNTMLLIPDYDLWSKDECEWGPHTQLGAKIEATPFIHDNYMDWEPQVACNFYCVTLCIQYHLYIVYPAFKMIIWCVL